MSRLKGQALIAAITSSYIKEVPSFNAGDTVKYTLRLKKATVNVFSCSKVL
jgi:large subunit ribosomal protein L19